MARAEPAKSPLISVVIVNYNGQLWLGRCLDSLETQTIFSQIEIILTDNNSNDGSDLFATQWLEGRRKGQVIQTGANLGFSAANNIGAEAAGGSYLFFLNSDTWLEPTCLETLCREVELHQAEGASPIVLDYDSDAFQSSGSGGLDLFGIPNGMRPVSRTTEVFAAPGCSLLVRRELFTAIGGFPSELFMFAEETDLAWRIWLAGGRVVIVPEARLHHRGAAAANPKGETCIVEFRTHDTKRFFTNRNGILLLLKNCQHLLLLLLLPHLLLLAAEALLSLLIVRRWSHIRHCYLKALTDCWRLRHHVSSWRARIRIFRRRSDFWMLRFLRWEPNRWPEVKRLFKFGLPKIDAR